MSVKCVRVLRVIREAKGKFSRLESRELSNIVTDSRFIFSLFAADVLIVLEHIMTNYEHSRFTRIHECVMMMIK